MSLDGNSVLLLSPPILLSPVFPVGFDVQRSEYQCNHEEMPRSTKSLLFWFCGYKVIKD